jgi:Reverse transcriptase (RNA-dependent DNA polymerase)/Integrase core domain/gag-polypeptide of LTR copia-type/GAG-pre-integrase domain
MSEMTHKNSNNQSLTNVLLNGKNYMPWARAIEVALGGKDKLGHINGEIIQPEIVTVNNKTDDSQFREWRTSDLGVMSSIFNSMEPAVYEIFAYAKTSKELWDSVKLMYGNTNNSSRIFEIHQNLSGLKQGTQSFTEYFGKVTKLWEELKQYRPPAETIEEYVQREEQDKVLKMLANLSPDFEEVRRGILTKSKFPSLGTICSLIQMDEDRRRVMPIETKVNSYSENSAHYSAFNNKGNKGKERKPPKPHCDYCHRDGHTQDRCWVLHPHLRPQKGKGAPAANTTIHLSQEGNPNADPTYLMQQQLNQMSQQMQRLLTSHQHAPTSAPSHFSAAPVTQPPSAATAFGHPFGSISANRNVTGATYGTSAPSQQSYQLHEKSVGYSTEPGYALNSHFNSDIVVDSGATDHMFNSTRLIYQTSNNLPYPYITVANGKNVPITGLGRTKIFQKDTNAIIVPELKTNLLSISKCTNEWDCNVLFTSQKVVFQDKNSGKKIGEGKQINGLYVLKPETVFCLTTNFNKESPHLWHNRLGHPSNKVMQYLNVPPYHDFNNCDPCHFAKNHRLPFPEHFNKSSNIFDLVHSDIWGNAPIISKDGFKYFISFIDDKSRATWIYLLKTKNETFKVFQDFCNLVRNQFDVTIKTLRTDNGTEYTNHEFQTYLRNLGIIHQTTCVGTPQQNGVAERKNRHLLEMTRALLFSSNIPKTFWADAILTSCYLINRLPSRVLNFKSPFEILYNRKFNISHLKVFGCICYVHSQNGSKLDPRARKCVFLGYSSTKKGYKCFDPNSRRTYFSRDVVFNEHQMYYAFNQGEPIEYELFAPPIPITNNEQESNQQPNESRILETAAQSNELQAAPSPIHEADGPRSPIEIQADDLDGPLAQIQPDAPLAQDQPATALRRSSRVIKPSTRLDQFVTYSTCHDIQDVIRYDKISKNFYSFLVNISNCSEPKNFEEASKNNVWVTAMNEELEALKKNNTWELTKLPIGKRTVGCRWIYKIKFNSDGTIERYKARLVAKGFTQTYGLDYKETFAPVAKMNTIRTLLSVVVNCDWPLFQMDVKNAFLQGELEEEVYMDLPQGLTMFDKKDVVCRLKKAIYGLKQSPRAWYGKLSTFLIKIGFKRSESDASMFTQKTSNGIVVILIYVDDLVITGDNLNGIESLKLQLKREFDIKDLGNLKYFLGIEIARSGKGLFLSQRKYVLDLLNESGKLGAKPATIPMNQTDKIVLDDEPLPDIKQFQRLVGKLIYLTITRPDITFTVSYISQFMQRPMQGHMRLVDQVLRYLKSAPGRGILMKNNGHTDIVGYADADWAGSPHDRKSTSGFCMFVGGNLVTWKSKKQSVVARSSAEAEYRAMAQATSEIVWLRTMLRDLDHNSASPTKLFCDNQAAIYIASNPVFHERTKHIEVACHYVRENVLNKTIETPYVNSRRQLADTFTKALPAKAFIESMHKLTSDSLYGTT